MFDSLLDRIGREDKIDIVWTDHAKASHLIDEGDQFLPVIHSHYDDGKVLDFSRLNQGERFEHFVEGASATGHEDECVGIFHEKGFADEEVMQGHATVEIVVWFLFERQLDVATDRAAANFFGAAICRFHDSGTAAGHYGKPETRHRCPHFPSEFIVGIVGLDSGRAEHRHARADEMQRSKSAQEIPHHPEKGD